MHKILLRGPNWVGDAVLAIPAMKAIRARFPDAEITLLVRPWVSGLFTAAPFIDRIWAEPRPSGAGAWMRLARGIRERRFDTAVLFPNSFESAAMAFLGRVPQRIGYARDGRSWLLTDRVRRTSGPQHQVEYYLELARALYADASQPSIRIQATAEEKEQARALLATERIGATDRYIVINPGAAYGSAKRWGHDRFAETADRLGTELSVKVVIIGSEAERVIAEQVRSSMTVPAAILNGRTSLETLIGVISGAALMVTNDSGPMHIAAALEVPTVAVFGATNDAATGPWGTRARVVKEAVDCSPCMLRECPIDHRCMTRVTAEAVCRAAREVMSA